MYCLNNSGWIFRPCGLLITTLVPIDYLAKPLNHIKQQPTNPKTAIFEIRSPLIFYKTSCMWFLWLDMGNKMTGM